MCTEKFYPGGMSMCIKYNSVFFLVFNIGTGLVISTGNICCCFFRCVLQRLQAVPVDSVWPLNHAFFSIGVVKLSTSDLITEQKY